MNENSLDRVRDDLAVMKQAVGFAVPFGREDVGFFVALSLTGLQFAVCHSLGASFLVSGIPAALAFCAYLGWMLKTSRRRSAIDPVRRREYRTTFVALLVILPAALLFREWSDRIGMTKLQFGGAILVVIGSVLAYIGTAGPRHMIYPRVYYLVGGLELVVFGLAVPFCTPRQATSLLGLCLAVVFGSLAWIMMRKLRCQKLESDHAHAAD